MSQAECPKCGQPREAEAAECPYCGVIYDRYRGGPAPPPLPPEAASAPQPPPAASTPPPASPPPTVALPEVYGEAPGDLYPGDVYQGDLYQPPSADAPGAVVRAPSASASGSHPVEKVDTVLTRNMLLALLVSGLLAIFAQGFWNQEMLNGSALTEDARDRFSSLTGVEAPDALDDGATLKLAGREWAWLARSDAPQDEPSLVAVAFRPGSLAGRMDRLDLLDSVERLMDRAELPWEEIASRETTVGGARGLTRTYGFGEAPVRVFALALETPSGDRSLVVLFGPTGRVAEETRRLVR